MNALGEGSTLDQLLDGAGIYLGCDEDVQGYSGYALVPDGGTAFFWAHYADPAVALAVAHGDATWDPATLVVTDWVPGMDEPAWCGDPEYVEARRFALLKHLEQAHDPCLECTLWGGAHAADCALAAVLVPYFRRERTAEAEIRARFMRWRTALLARTRTWAALCAFWNDKAVTDYAVTPGYARASRADHAARNAVDAAQGELVAAIEAATIPITPA